MMPDPISDAELDAILNRNRINGSVSMLRPIELTFSREALLDVSRRSLATFKDQAPLPEEASPREHRARHRAIQQRIDFIEWLGAQPDQITLSLYPVEDDGLTDDDVKDVLDDPDLWPFMTDDDE